MKISSSKLWKMTWKHFQRWVTEDTRWTKTIKGWSDHDILAHQFNSKFYSTSWINKTQLWLDISTSHLMSYFASSSCGWWLYNEISNDTSHTKAFFLLFCTVEHPELWEVYPAAQCLVIDCGSFAHQRKQERSPLFARGHYLKIHL